MCEGDLLKFINWLLKPYILYFTFYNVLVKLISEYTFYDLKNILLNIIFDVLLLL